MSRKVLTLFFSVVRLVPENVTIWCLVGTGAYLVFSRFRCICFPWIDGETFTEEVAGQPEWKRMDAWLISLPFAFNWSK